MNSGILGHQVIWDSIRKKDFTSAWKGYGKVRGANTLLRKHITKFTWHNIDDITQGGMVSIKQEVDPENQEVRKMTCALGGF